MTDYLILFVSAFGAATILPFYSELTLVGMLYQGHSSLSVWWVASLGNTLGAALNWMLARYLLRYQERKWFPFKPVKLGRAQRWFQRWGKWSLLFAWLPIGGDALTFVAGLMRVQFGIFLVLTFIGKAARYAAVIFIYHY
ncbi:MAG: hypothetical protein C9356_01515 [Oleiphilus sp.]|nr:MAG: hypothetical protein C9356_01515 [Oleiphilus sp.]